MEKAHTKQFLKRRRFLLALPLLFLPFITLGFYSLGGGSAERQEHAAQNQLNNELPEVKLSTAPLDKMSLYRQADMDSVNKVDLSGRNLNDTKADSLRMTSENPQYPGGLPQYTNGNASGYTDANEARVMQKLSELERIMNQQPQSFDAAASVGRPVQGAPDGTEQMSRIENIMKSMESADRQNPELDHLNTMLEKIMDIQNPSRAEQKLKQLSGQHRSRVYPIDQFPSQDAFTVLKTNSSGVATPGFYDLEALAVVQDTLTQSAISAVIQGTQTLVTGSTVKMLLNDSIYVNGQMIPKGVSLSGICSLDGERLKIAVKGIRFKNNIFPVSLVVYDLDAIEGIRIPDAIAREAAKEGADRAVQSLQLMSLDPSVAAQAAGAGVEAVKGLVGKKVKLIRVTVKAGHPLLLLDLNSLQAAN